MEYFMTFIEGIVSFISPCMLPMLPVYISYFAGESGKKSWAIISAIAFVAGFTVIFCTLGFFAGSIGAMLHQFHSVVDIVCGIIIIFLGLNFLGVIKIPFLKGIHPEHKVTGIFTAFLFGVFFSISHMPCIGAFLGAALMTASASGSMIRGILMLLTYSLGMGIPFLICALLTEKLAPSIAVIKRNYKTINLISGILLILLGTAMATGLIHKLEHLIA